MRPDILEIDMGSLPGDHMLFLYMSANVLPLYYSPADIQDNIGIHLIVLPHAL